MNGTDDYRRQQRARELTRRGLAKSPVPLEEAARQAERAAAFADARAIVAGAKVDALHGLRDVVAGRSPAHAQVQRKTLPRATVTLGTLPRLGAYHRHPDDPDRGWENHVGGSVPHSHGRSA